MALSDPRMSAGAIVLQGTIISLGNPSEVLYLVAPEAGYIKELHCARNAAGGTGTTDLAIVTPAGAVTPVLTLTTAGAGGDVDSLELSKYDTNNAVAAQGAIHITCDGDFSGTPSGNILLILEPF